MKTAGAKRKQPSKHDLRLVPAALGVWGSSAWAVSSSASAVQRVGLITGIAALALIAGVIALRKRTPLLFTVVGRTALIGLLAIGISSCVLLMTSFHQGRWETSLLYEASNLEGRAELQISLVTDPTEIPARTRPSWGQQRVSAKATTNQVKYRNHVRAEKTRILIVGGPGLLDLTPGQEITVRGKIRPADPGASHRVVIFTDDEYEVLTKPTGVHSWGAVARGKFRAAVSPLPPAARGLIPGMVIGDTAQIPDEIVQSLRDTSLTHLTAVSGAHCTLVIAGALALTQPPRAWPPQRRAFLRTSIATAVLLGFAIVTGPQPSVLRAGVMGAIGLLGIMSGRKSKALAALACAVIVLISIDPWLARSIGFNLSVCSTAAIVTSAGPLAQRMQQWHLLGRRQIPKTLALPLAVSASAQIACLPLLLTIDPRLTLYALPANLLATPIFPLVSLPGVFALAMVLVIPPLATPLLWLASGPAWLIAEIAQRLAALPGATIPWPPSPATWWALSIGALITLSAHVFSRKIEQNRRSIALIALVAASGFVFVTCTAPGAALREHVGFRDVADRWFALQCDVGQADALLLRSSAGSVVMVDVGLPDGEAAACLRDAKVKRIDLLILSHWHLDHVGGIAEVLSEVPVAEIWVPAWEEPVATATPAWLAINGEGVSARVAEVGMSAELPGIHLEVLWPTPRALQLAPVGADDGTTVNDLSTVIAAQISAERGVFSVLALGDVEELGQSGLYRELRDDPTHEFDVVKMAHHGSRRQSQQLAQLLNPRSVLIGVGADNDYGHPSENAWRIYEDLGAQIGSTDRHGVVKLVEGDRGSIKMLVEDQGG